MDYRAADSLWLLAALGLLHSSQAKQPFRVKLNNFTCINMMPSVVEEINCFLHSYQHKPTISLSFRNKQTVSQFALMFNLAVIRQDNSKTTLAQYKLDGCQYLKAFYSKNLYGKLYKRLQSVSNLPKRCPVQANKLYEIRNYTVLTDEYPPLPALMYQLQVKILRADSAVVADVFIEVAVIY